MKYQIWDTETGNYLETLDSEDEVSAAIEEYVEANGEQYRRALGVRPIPESRS